MFYTTPRIVYHTHKHSDATFVEGKVILTITKMFLFVVGRGECSIFNL